MLEDELLVEEKDVLLTPEEPQKEKVPQEPKPIDIEIEETDTVIMVINGESHVVYDGSAFALRRQPPKKAAKKPAAKPAKKPAPKPAAKPAANPAPAKAPAEPKIIYKTVKRPPIIQRKNKGPVKPTRKLASFGPGTSDDGLHSIHTDSFEEKVEKAPKDIKKYYNDLSKYLVEEYGCAHRVSFGYDAYRVGKKTIVAISLGGVHLRINAAIDPKKFDGTRLKVNDDSASRKYKDLPSYLKVMSDKSMAQAIRLIDETMKANGVKKVVKPE